jgi:hypothetical protein
MNIADVQQPQQHGSARYARKRDDATDAIVFRQNVSAEHSR